MTEQLVSLQDFIDLSVALTGQGDLDPDLAAEYLARFQANPDVGSVLPVLVATFQAIQKAGGDPAPAIGRQIMGDAVLRPAAQQLIYLWYVSAFWIADPADPAKQKGSWQYGPPQHYERGLMWRVIGAHAPMTFGGPADYWTRPPAIFNGPDPGGRP